jgi:endonuclease/exonuclease/phosphatase family metal-dependent hydrolase
MKLYLKVNKKYMLTTNLNLSDGLCNGTVGILKRIILEEDIDILKPKVARVWLQFEGDTGKQQRYINKNLNAVDNIPSQENWTPMTCTTQTIFRPKTGNYRIHRTQFPMVESEAMTIHKSQGQTFSSVAVYIDNENGRQSLTQKLMYVALSRCESLKGLFLFGTSSIRPKDLNEKDLRRKATEKSNESGKIEMNRLRTTAQVVLQYDFALENYQTQHLTVMYQNVNNIGDKFEKLFSINNNIGFRHADIIFLSECHTNIKNVQHIKYNDNYSLLPGAHMLSYGIKLNSSHGQMCFIHSSIANRVKFVDRNRREFDTNRCAEIELFSFSYGNNKILYLMSTYFHPELKESEKAYELTKFFKKQKWQTKESTKEEIVIFGDMNCDFNKDTKDFAKLLTTLGFYPSLKKTMTHIKGNQLDWVLTNRAKSRKRNPTVITTIYPTWYSDHAALHTKIKLTD